MHSSPQTQPSPALIWETLGAYVRTAALRGGVELDLFTAIAEGTATVPALAARTGGTEKGVRVLCDYLTIIGFLTKQDGAYSLTADSAVFLNRHSPAYLGTITRFLGTLEHMGCFNDVPGIVRKGGTLLPGDGTVSRDNPVWQEFARSMAPLARGGADGIAALVNAGAGQPMKVLDIAAGHGLYGIATARHNPHAQIYAQDWADVLEIASENAQVADVEDRYFLISGSAFEVEFGSDYDAVLITNFLHHFDPATCEKLLRKVHAALKPGGRVIILEFVPNEDRISPPQAAAFSMMMLGTTAHGDAYTFSEYQRMLANAGFPSSELHDLPPTPEQVVIAHK